MTSPSRLNTLFALLTLTSAAAIAAPTGYIESPWTPTTCLQGSHFFTEPCTGYLTILEETPPLDIDPFACSFVEVTGPDIGVTCEVIEASSVVPSSTSCPIRFQELWFTGAAPPQVLWYRVTCASSYDMIRGDLSAVTPGISQIDLGTVACLAENVPQANWWSISGPADGDTPAVGQAYFYLVRHRSLALGDETYGRSTSGLERMPFSGDCTL